MLRVRFASRAVRCSVFVPESQRRLPSLRVSRPATGRYRESGARLPAKNPTPRTRQKRPPTGPPPTCSCNTPPRIRLRKYARNSTACGSTPEAAERSLRAARRSVPRGSRRPRELPPMRPASPLPRRRPRPIRRAWPPSFASSRVVASLGPEVPEAARRRSDRANRAPARRGRDDPPACDAAAGRRARTRAGGRCPGPRETCGYLSSARAARRAAARRSANGVRIRAGWSRRSTNSP